MGDDMGYPILKLPHRVLHIFGILSKDWDIRDIDKNTQSNN